MYQEDNLLQTPKAKWTKLLKTKKSSPRGKEPGTMITGDTDHKLVKRGGEWDGWHTWRVDVIEAPEYLFLTILLLLYYLYVLLFEEQV